MQRIFNIILILTVYFGILYHRDLENHKKITPTTNTHKQKKHTLKQYSKNIAEDLY